MLTGFGWVPQGGMCKVPIRSSDSKDELRQKLQLRYDPDEEASAIQEVTADLEENVISDGNILQELSSDDESELNDITFQDADAVFFALSANEEEPSMELYVYDEPKDNMFLHHDVPLAAFPLCAAWCTNGSGSFAAVGSMLPFIEVWSLDVMDAVEPVVLLGGCKNASDNYKRKIRKDRLMPDSHSDAVLSLKWNVQAPHIMASGAADGKLKLWDLSTAVCMGTYDEGEKIQALDWHNTEPHLLLSGDNAGKVVARDCRDPSVAAVTWNLGNDVERISWSQHGNHVFASCTSGEVMCFEARKGSDPLWCIQAHDKEAIFALSPHVGGLMATAGHDGNVSLWDFRGAEPYVIVSRAFGQGATFGLQFHPNFPSLLGGCGSAGKPLVYTITSDVGTTFNS